MVLIIHAELGIVVRMANASEFPGRRGLADGFRREGPGCDQKQAGTQYHGGGDPDHGVGRRCRGLWHGTCLSLTVHIRKFVKAEEEFVDSGLLAYE